MTLTLTQSALWRGAAILAFLAFAPTHGAALAQEPPVKLFKVITAKDEVVIGLTDPELRSFGPRALAERLVSAGQVTAWQYAVQRAARRCRRHCAVSRCSIRHAAHRALQSGAAESPAAAVSGHYGAMLSGRATLSSGCRSAFTPIASSTSAAPTISAAPNR